MDDTVNPSCLCSMTHLSLHDLLHSPSKTERALQDLSCEQIGLIEQTIHRAKKRKLESAATATLRPSSTTTTSAAGPVSPKRQQNQHEPMVEIRDGVEWVSFLYSHNRVLKRYTIRTDIQNVHLDRLEDQFKLDNCVYPRANLPKETYRGNRWNYETECNRLGWKLAWLNASEIAGKRGLIQRAVDSYRNRLPSMRSRRVARQAKLMNGTLRKRIKPDDELEEDMDEDNHKALLEEEMRAPFPRTLAAATVKSAHSPKTLIIGDSPEERCRIKINVETVSMDVIPDEFRAANCAFPDDDSLEASICNELGYKLAWLNARHLAGKIPLLVRAIDLYRVKFMPAFQQSCQGRERCESSPPASVKEEHELQQQQEEQESVQDIMSHDWMPTTVTTPEASTSASSPSLSPPPMPALSYDASVPPTATSTTATTSIHPIDMENFLATLVDNSDNSLLWEQPALDPPADDWWLKMEQDDFAMNNFLSLPASD
ncbi:hypothetical protein BCR43DRAFT_527779 [Syncephalastrum racemosum]|uniref:DUF8032 domain-containing protein n=1 Tax=Syncephalastrum racemosum TaxID=13706 RepID=A0A1X2H172_SYNRA|nr:hypothetical protein BCR43DRAFT_527779 [Syncephalastrum racemosum]